MDSVDGACVQAFDVLERLDPDPTYWEGKRAACVGVFQQVQILLPLRKYVLLACRVVSRHNVLLFRIVRIATHMLSGLS